MQEFIKKAIVSLINAVYTFIKEKISFAETS